MQIIKKASELVHFHFVKELLLQLLTTGYDMEANRFVVVGYIYVD